MWHEWPDRAQTPWQSLQQLRVHRNGAPSFGKYGVTNARWEKIQLDLLRARGDRRVGLCDHQTASHLQGSNTRLWQAALRNPRKRWGDIGDSDISHIKSPKKVFTMFMSERSPDSNAILWGWGTFDITVLLKWKSGAVQRTIWELQFDQTDAFKELQARLCFSEMLNMNCSRTTVFICSCVVCKFCTLSHAVGWAGVGWGRLGWAGMGWDGLGCVRTFLALAHWR